MKKVRTRIAPSPTGNLHIGTVRSALFNFLFAHHENGEFIVRIEDTDKERDKKEYEEDILSGLAWLGLKHDALYRQSEHIKQHTKALNQLITLDKAYVSREKKKDDPTKEVDVIRLRNKGEDISFNDLIRGEITFNTEELGDFVIARSITEPLYHLAVVVDDHDEEITHVIRGEDHISNTPRQILIGKALDYEQPLYAHIPLILAPDHTKLSKRKGAVSLTEYRKMGYLKEAIVNYLALLGWNPGATDQEFFSMEELVTLFSLEKIQKGGAIFSQEKLNWFNHHYIEHLPLEEAAQLIESFLPEEVRNLDGYTTDKVKALTPTLRERLSRFDELTEQGKIGELDYYFMQPTYDASDLLPKGESSEQATVNHLREILVLLGKIDSDIFTEEIIKNAVWAYADKEGRGAVLWPMRFALSGKSKSPDPFSLASLLGKAETISRLETAIKLLVPHEH